MTRSLNRRQLLTGAAAFTGATAAGVSIPNVLASAATWGDLVGRLVYDGAPPERKKLKVDKDVECCGKHDIRDESLMAGADGGLANVYLYVRTRKVDVCPEIADSAAKRITLDNKDCIFKPHCFTIWYPKQEFHIVNSDPIAQNVAFSPLGDTPANIVLVANTGKQDANTVATHKFNRAQMVPVPIACNYHPWESAYILPRDNPYATITAADGMFRITRLPVGTLEFQVWHERVGYLDTPDWPKGRFSLEIQPGGNDLGTVKIAPATLEKK